MKFMMNGALTIGTMDGANVEIVEHASKENAFIFGLTSDEVTAYYQNHQYQPRAVYEHDERLHMIFEYIRGLDPNPQHFDYILNQLLNGDYFFVLKDFDAYAHAQEQANKLYQDRKAWFQKSLMNIASSGYFSSDRTIESYAKDIWHIEPINF